MGYKELLCYKYEIENEDKNLVVNVHSYSGNPDIYVNSITKPKKKDDFQSNSKGSLDDQLVITAEERQKYSK